MNKNPVLFILDENNDYLRYTGIIKALSGYKDQVLVITPQAVAVGTYLSVSMMPNNANYNRYEQYVIPTTEKVSEYIDSDDVLSQTTLTWHVYKTDIKPEALTEFSAFRSGSISFSFAFQQINPSSKCVEYQGVFGVDNPLPATATLGDYYECEDWDYSIESGTHTYAFSKGMYVYWNGTRWVKDRLKTLGSATAVDLPVEPNHAVGAEFDDDETMAVEDTINQVVVNGQNIASNTQDIADMVGGTKAFDEFLMSDGTSVQPNLNANQDGDIMVRDTDGNYKNSQRLVEAESDIANIEDGTTVVGKATADKNGNDIVDTYETKTDATTHKARTTALETFRDVTVPNTYETIVNVDTKVQGAIDELDTQVELKVSTSDIVNNLTSTNTNKPLSANQGKVLNDKIDEIITSNAEEISVQEIVDARKGKATLGQKITHLENGTKKLSEKVFKHPKTRQRKVPKPMVTFIDDDGRTDVWEKWKPIIEEKGIPISIAVISGRVDVAENVMTLEQLRTLESLGCEIVSHGHTHPGPNGYIDLTENEIRQDLQQCIDWMNENEIGDTRFHIVPYANDNETVRKVLRELHDLAFLILGSANTSPINSMRVNRIGYETLTLQEIKDLVDDAFDNNKWIVFVTHAFYETWNEEGFEQKLKDTIDYIRQKNIPITTIAEAYEHWGNIIEYGDFTKPSTLQDYDNVNVIGPDGKFFGDTLGSTRFLSYRHFENLEDLNGAIENFRINCTTKVFVNHSSATTLGFPENTGGMLEVVYTSTLGFQSYRVSGTNNVYLRRYQSFNSTWSAWEKILTIKDQIADSGTFDNSTLATDIPEGIHTNPLSTAQATGMPTSYAGILVTIRPSNVVYTKQKYFVHLSNQSFSRYWTGSGWSVWRKSDATFEETNSRDGDTPSTYFDVGVTANAVTHLQASASGLPTKRAGILFTYRADDDGNFVRQDYRGYQDTFFYTRYKIVGSSWSNWLRVDNGFDESQNAHDGDNNPEDFYVGNTITRVTNASASATNLPESRAGILTTMKSTEDDAYTRQDYRVYDSNGYYTRRATNPTSWSSWVKILNVDDVIRNNQEFLNDNVITDFPLGITTNIVNALSATGFPEDTAGTLTTYRMRNDEYSHQEYKLYKQNVKYMRYVSSGTTWGAWEKVYPYTP